MGRAIVFGVTGGFVSIQSNFYQTRAAEERDKAIGSSLDNVRDGHLRAAAAWDALAARSMKADRMPCSIR